MAEATADLKPDTESSADTGDARIVGPARILIIDDEAAIR
jgi:hypothetical protein